MSDSVTNVDVEDVLSSIRRLVSDTSSDARVAPEPAPQEQVDTLEAEAKPSDALLLTSALRVNSKPEADEAAEVEHTADLSNLRDAISDDKSSEDTTPEWPPAATDDYYEDEEPEDSNPVIDFIRHDRAQSEGHTETVHSEEAEPHREQEEVSDEAEELPDATDEDDGEHDTWSPHVVEAESEVEQDFDDADDVPFEFAESEVAENDEEPALDWVEAGHAEISEAKVVEIDEADTHDAEQSDENAGEIDPEPEVIFASAAAASVFVDNEDEDKSDEAAELADFDESVLDEDALRDLVSEIVRQELTGELGERITRNVRKLVRREIHRALLTREFE